MTRIFLGIIMLGVFLYATANDSSQSLEGTWSLEYLVGLEEAFDKVEAEFAAKEQKILWGEPKVPGLLKFSYEYKLLRNQTWYILTGSNPHISIFDGNINNGIETLKFKEALPPTLRYATSQVLLPSGDIVPTAPAPVEVAMSHFFKVSKEAVKTDISENGKLWTAYGQSNDIIATFKRVETAQ